MEICMVISVRVIIELDGDMFRARAPALPGLLICTETKGEAITAARDGVVEYLALLDKLEKPLPVGSDLIVESISVKTV